MYFALFTIYVLNRNVGLFRGLMSFSFSHSKTRRFRQVLFILTAVAHRRILLRVFDQSSNPLIVVIIDYVNVLWTRLFPLNPLLPPLFFFRSILSTTKGRHRKDCISFLCLVPVLLTSLNRERKIWFQVLGNLCLFRDPANPLLRRVRFSSSASICSFGSRSNGVIRTFLCDLVFHRSSPWCPFSLTSQAGSIIK